MCVCVCVCDLDDGSRLIRSFIHSLIPFTSVDDHSLPASDITPFVMVSHQTNHLMGDCDDHRIRMFQIELNSILPIFSLSKRYLFTNYSQV